MVLLEMPLHKFLHIFIAVSFSLQTEYSTADALSLVQGDSQDSLLSLVSAGAQCV